MLIRQLRSQIAEIRAEEASGDGPSDAFEIQEDEERVQLWAVIKPAIKRFLDTEYLVAILSGDEQPARGDGKRLREPLRALRDGVNRRRFTYSHLEKAVARRQSAKQLASALSPHQIMILERYLSRIEKRIEKKLRQLHAH